MNYWIDGKRDALWEVLKHIDILVINDGEARALGEDANLVQVAKRILARGPKTLIIKRGEYGVLMFHQKGIFGAPAYPLETVKDPTGAGDTFAGALWIWMRREIIQMPQFPERPLFSGASWRPLPWKNLAWIRLNI